jgi:hypothetical protein
MQDERRLVGRVLRHWTETVRSDPLRRRTAWMPNARHKELPANRTVCC